MIDPHFWANLLIVGSWGTVFSSDDHLFEPDNDLFWSQAQRTKRNRT
jgi:hypothetical protein